MNVYKQKTNKIIHESGWAISKKCGNKVYKIFPHDSYPKIRKEVLLLQLSLEKEVNLLYDISNEHWLCESDHMELRPIICNIGLSDFTAQLQAKFSTWKNDSRYRAPYLMSGLHVLPRGIVCYYNNIYLTLTS